MQIVGAKSRYRVLTLKKANRKRKVVQSPVINSQSRSTPETRRYLLVLTAQRRSSLVEPQACERIICICAFHNRSKQPHVHKTRQGSCGKEDRIHDHEPKHEQHKVGDRTWGRCQHDAIRLNHKKDYDTRTNDCGRAAIALRNANLRATKRTAPQLYIRKTKLAVTFRAE